MQTYLIVSRENTFVQKEIDRLTGSGTSPFDVHTVTATTTAAIGIADIRALKTLLNLAPYDGKKRFIRIADIDRATPEAQHALLKILEEPPADTFLVLTAQSQSTILATIVSRCIVVQDHTYWQAHAASEDARFFQDLLKKTAGQRLLYTSTISSKDEALTTVEQCIRLLRASLFVSAPFFLSPSEIALLLPKLTHARQFLLHTIAWQATIDTLFLSFPYRP